MWIFLTWSEILHKSKINLNLKRKKHEKERENGGTREKKEQTHTHIHKLTNYRNGTHTYTNFSKL